MNQELFGAVHGWTAARVASVIARVGFAAIGFGAANDAESWVFEVMHLAIYSGHDCLLRQAVSESCAHSDFVGLLARTLNEAEEWLVWNERNGQARGQRFAGFKFDRFLSIHAFCFFVVRFHGDKDERSMLRQLRQIEKGSRCLRAARVARLREFIFRWPLRSLRVLL